MFSKYDYPGLTLLDVDHTIIDTYRCVKENQDVFKSKVNLEKNYRFFENDDLIEIKEDIFLLDKISFHKKYIKEFITDTVLRISENILVVTKRPKMNPRLFLTVFSEMRNKLQGVINVRTDIDKKYLLDVYPNVKFIFDDNLFLEENEVPLDCIFYQIDPVKDSFKKITGGFS